MEKIHLGYLDLLVTDFVYDDCGDDGFLNDK